MYQEEFDSEWDKHFEKMPKNLQIRIWKQINKILNGLPTRHLEHGVPFFVEEFGGQYRICYKSFEDKKIMGCCTTHA